MNRPLWTYEGLDQKTIQKLVSNGFHSKEDVDKNIEAAKKICENIHDILYNEKQKCTWKSGLEILHDEKHRQHVTTMSKYLDDLLNGGIELGKLSEIYGNSGSGKTQLCMQLAINVTLPKLLGGLEAESVYIETSKSVFPRRLVEMVDAFVEHVTINLELKKKMKSCHSERSGVQDKTYDECEKDKTGAANEINVENVCNISERKGSLSPDFYLTKSCVKNEHTLVNVTSTRTSETSKQRNVQGCQSNGKRLQDVGHESEHLQNSDELPTSSKKFKSEPENPSKEFKVNMTRTDLTKLINQSKQSNTNLNQFLHTKLGQPNSLSRDTILSKIHIHYCANYYEILALVFNIEKNLASKKAAKIKLIVIDNITFLFHSEDDSNYLKRTKNVYFLLNMLWDLARKYDLAVVVVNQLTTKYEGSKRKVVSALGETFAHRMQVRLLIQKFNLATSGGVGVKPESSILGTSGTVLESDYPGVSHHTTDLDDETQLFMCLVDKMSVQNAALANKKHVVFQINSQGVRDV